jgi:hypothetical protein
MLMGAAVCHAYTDPPYWPLSRTIRGSSNAVNWSENHLLWKNILLGNILTPKMAAVSGEMGLKTVAWTAHVTDFAFAFANLLEVF